jgi:hypothetical protein
VLKYNVLSFEEEKAMLVFYANSMDTPSDLNLRCNSLFITFTMFCNCIWAYEVFCE